MSGDYLRYLPPALWDNDDGNDLRRLVAVAEEMLSRENLGDRPVHKPATGAVHPLPPHTHGGLEGTIDRLHELLDPRIAPERFLPWLAGSVGTELSPLWGEVQGRQAIAMMVGVWRRRGSTDGLKRFLDLHAAATTRPLITVDDGTSVFRTTLVPGRRAQVHALLCQGPTLNAAGVTVVGGAAHPRCIAATPEGDLLLGDGGLSDTAAGLPPGVWRVTRTGEYRDRAGAPPTPVPLGRTVVIPGPPPGPGAPAVRLRQPAGIVVEGGPGAWTAYVLDSAALYKLTSGQTDQITQVKPASDLGSGGLPEAMVGDGTGRLLIVNRVDTKIIEVNLLAPGGVTVTGHDLTAGVQPRGIAVVGRDLVVADTGNEANSVAPADLIWVNRERPQWTQSRLLANLPTNPLVSPVAILLDGNDLLVLDVGVRPLTPPGTFVMRLAKPAAVYRVKLDRTTANVRVTGIERVTELGRMCFPRGMVMVDGVLYIGDPGFPERGSNPPMLRGLPHQFGVFVHFPSQSAAEEPKRLKRSIADMVNRQKPAASAAWLNWDPINPT